MQAYNFLYFQGGSIREPEQGTHRRAQVIERAVHRYPATYLLTKRQFKTIRAQSNEGSKFRER
jgi:hypothetical protein